MKHIIAVKGNYGKTVFSFFLAEKLSKTNKVALISTDTQKSIYRCLFPQNKKNSASLGKLLADPVVTIQDINENSNIINENLIMLSYAKGESGNMFPEITNANCTKLFIALSNIVDIIIVDTSNHHTFDNFILSNPQTKKITVTTADIRGLHYRLIDDSADINILWFPSKYNSYQDVISTFQKAPFELPYMKNFEGIYNGSNITDISTNKKYIKELEKIIDEVEQL